jgi:DNA polymerase III alpha subunit
VSDIIPLFSSAASLKQGGIFTVDKVGDVEARKKEGRKRGPLSLCSLAKDEGMKRLYMVESNFVNYMSAWKNLREVGCDLHFGLKLVICENMADKSEASMDTESKVVIWPALDSTTVYSALCKLFTKAANDGFYYVPRLDWKTLCAMWSDDLLLSLPFYSSFLAKNTLTFSSIAPQLPVVPLLLREIDQQLPIDGLLNSAVDRYAAANGLKVQPVKSVYYKLRDDAKPFQVWRCVLNRSGKSTYDKPNMDFMQSREFSFEAWKELSAQQIVSPKGKQ